jgi:transposase
MAKSKWPQVKDKLILVQKWARDGLTEEQIAKNLGIGKNTMNNYKNEHEDFRAALKKGKEVAVTEVENALFKRALGYEYEEVKTYMKVESDGKEVTYTERTVKHEPPNVAACIIILKNKDKENWVDNPHMIELKKRELELRERLADLGAW